VEWNHDFKAAGADAEEVKTLYLGANGAAGYLFNDSDPMVWVNHLFADSEEGHCHS
jgi:hypothetical protein